MEKVSINETSLTGEEIVISGISGCFPNTENIQELIHNLYNKEQIPDALSKIFNTLDASLNQKYTSVLISDSKSKVHQNNHTDDGLSALFGKIPEEEYSAVEPVVCMKTLVTHVNESEMYIDPDEACVMLIPGFDGYFQTLTSISEKLKIPAIALQLEADFETSVTEIANRLLTIVKDMFTFKSKFYLVGYSFGAIVALELAALLEKEGSIGVVFCLDSSPDAIKHQLATYTHNMNEQQLQNSLLEHFYNLLTGKPFEAFRDSPQTLEWPDKIDISIEHVKDSVTYTHEFLKSLVNIAYRRICMAKDYNPDFKLDSELVLMKGIPYPEMEKISDDYGLSKYSNKPVIVFDLKADHAKAAEDIRVSNIVNKMLDPQILQEFESKNLCEYYFY